MVVVGVVFFFFLAGVQIGEKFPLERYGKDVKPFKKFISLHGDN
jgi:hypothetical protein